MDSAHSFWVMLVGGMVVAAVLLGAAARRLRIDSVVLLILFGLLIGAADRQLAFMTAQVRATLAFLGDMGVVALLFRIGLDSNLSGLLSALPRALRVWAGDVGLSGSLAFLAAFVVLDLALVPSLVIAVAMSATSVGVTAATWESAHRLDTPEGRLLLDVAELDDISAIALLALLFAVLPFLQAPGHALGPVLIDAGASFAARIAAFAAFCYVFARYAEPRIAVLAARLHPARAKMLLVAGFGFMIAALAGGLDLSLAVGALFAGVVFSRDPAAVRVEARFDDLYAFFVPFFFIAIGMSVDATNLAGGLGTALVLLVAAVTGKLLGGGIPALAFTGTTGAIAIGASLVPRAEVALYVAAQAHAAGADVLPADVYAAVVLVALVTMLIAPLVLRPLLSRPFALRRGQA